MIPLVDLSAQYFSIKSEIDAAISGVLETGQFILGPNLLAFESEIARYLGVKHAVGVASGTDALVIALRSAGIGPGDEVIVPAFTFFATIGAVLLVGATPIFVDISPDTYCIDTRQIANKMSTKTKAIIPVHLYGHPADMTRLLEIAKKHELLLIEDNAQAFGSEFLGKKTGAIGDIGCLSFFPTKILGAYGDAGMVVTNNDELAENIRSLRTHGWNRKFYPETLGYNSRLDELHAAVLRVKLAYVDQWTLRRREIAHYYCERFLSLQVVAPSDAANLLHVYHLFVIRVSERSRVQKALKENQIDSAIYYPQPLHLAEPCKFLGHEVGDFPEAERAGRETLAIPIFPEMTSEQIDSVVETIENAL